MQDEEYQPEQIPSYGTGEQLALAARMRPQLRLTQIGNGFAVLGVLAAVAALVIYPRILYGDDAGRAYAVGALICSVVLLALCTFQHFCWLRAMAVWRGQSHADLRQLSSLSYAAQIAAYLVGIAALWACIAGIVFAGWTATAAILLMLSLGVHADRPGDGRHPVRPDDGTARDHPGPHAAVGGTGQPQEVMRALSSVG